MKKVTIWLFPLDSSSFYIFVQFFIWKPKQKREEVRQTESILQLVYSPNARNSQGLVRPNQSQGTQSRSPMGQQGIKYLNHHLLPPRVDNSRKLEWKPERGLKLNHSGKRCGYLTWWFKHCTICAQVFPFWKIRRSNNKLSSSSILNMRPITN